MKILIFGANGFIGSHLTHALLSQTDHIIFAIDQRNDQLGPYLSHPRFHFFLGDMTLEKKWAFEQVQQCDVVLPLAGIATPGSYIKCPLRIFELDFEANLEIVRLCVRFKKRLVFPSTSEVYGMCEDAEFDEATSQWVVGPLHKQRWIYANCKQLLDRLIYAYGQEEGLPYTLFRPFNWYGPNLDDLTDGTPGRSRVLTQFIGHVLRGENIMLVAGGEQRRSFTYISDGTDALLKIIENKNNQASGRIFNIGNPLANRSIRELAERLVLLVRGYPEFRDAADRCQLISVPAEDYYGEGYQDVTCRVPSIKLANEYLNWQPKVSLEEGLQKTLDFYISKQLAFRNSLDPCTQLR